MTRSSSNTTINNTTVSSFPIVGILGLIFITLKLTGVITWSWVWVLAPFWIPVALVLLIMVVLAIIAIVAGLVSDSRRNR